MRATAFLLVLGILGCAACAPGPRKLTVGQRTTAEVQQAYGPAARARLVPHFARAGVAYPPARVRLLALKQERRLELWADDEGGRRRLVHTWPVLAASGGPGPKLREGDRQVPEGMYRLTVLNPASKYHLSVRVDYPNAFDRARAAEDGRTQLGGDIYVHGRDVSIGCLAIGDPAIEELFVLLADAGLRDASIVIAPSATPHVPAGAPAWVASLYDDLRRELQAFDAAR
jgi:hypothetical protein